MWFFKTRSVLYYKLSKPRIAFAVCATTSHVRDRYKFFFFPGRSYAKRKRYFFMGPIDGSGRDLWAIPWLILIFQKLFSHIKNRYVLALNRITCVMPKNYIKRINIRKNYIKNISSLLCILSIMSFLYI